jgi:hypothetical protein
MATYRKFRDIDYGKPIIAPTHGDTVAPQNDLAAAAWLPISSTATNAAAGYFTYEELKPYHIEFEIYTNPTIRKIQAYYENCCMGGMSIKKASTYPILILLFLSMLPLHNDNSTRQQAFLANALRLYIEFKKQN